MQMRGIPKYIRQNGKVSDRDNGENNKESYLIVTVYLTGSVDHMQQ